MHVLKLSFHGRDLFIKGGHLSYFVVESPGLELHDLGLIGASEGFSDFLNGVAY
jgi:hypothetical protein